MEPIHFGARGRALFGIYHSPQSGFSPAAWVMCNPLGNEAMRTFMLYRDVARDLARRDVHVLRFDYTGCGDSHGAEADYGIGRWLEDIELAAAEIRDISGASSVSLVGVRLGASLALLSALRSHFASRLVLIDPVVRGNVYVERLRRAHAAMLRDSNRFRAPRRTEDAPHDLLGFALTPEFVHELEALDLLSVAGVSVQRVDLVATRAARDASELHEYLAASSIATTMSFVDCNPEWDDGTLIERSLVVPALIEKVVSLAVS